MFDVGRVSMTKLIFCKDHYLLDYDNTILPATLPVGETLIRWLVAKNSNILYEFYFSVLFVLTCDDFSSCISDYIDIELWDVIIHACPYFNVSWDRPPLKSGMDAWLNPTEIEVKYSPHISYFSLLYTLIKKHWWIKLFNHSYWPEIQLDGHIFQYGKQLWICRRGTWVHNHIQQHI